MNAIKTLEVGKIYELSEEDEDSMLIMVTRVTQLSDLQFRLRSRRRGKTPRTSEFLFVDYVLLAACTDEETMRVWTSRGYHNNLQINPRTGHYILARGYIMDYFPKNSVCKIKAVPIRDLPLYVGQRVTDFFGALIKGLE